MSLDYLALVNVAPNTVACELDMRGRLYNARSATTRAPVTVR